MRFPYTLTPLFCAWGGILLFDHLFVYHFVSLVLFCHAGESSHLYGGRRNRALGVLSHTGTRTGV